MDAAVTSARLLLSHADGSLHDADTHRVVTLDDLLDGLRSGRRFRVRSHRGSVDRTAEVLVEVLALALRRGYLAQPGGSFGSALLGPSRERGPVV